MPRSAARAATTPELRPVTIASFDAGALHQNEAEAVLDIEGLQLVAVVGVVQAAIGHHAVDIEGDELDAGGAGLASIR
jgi:hypothetical protein